MSTVIIDFWLSGWESAKKVTFLQAFLDMLKNNWSAGNVPTIGFLYDYRSIDLANREYILISIGDIAERHYGLGSDQYLKTISVSVSLKTGVSSTRADVMMDECRRICRTRSLWIQTFQNLRISRNTNMNERERKTYSYKFTVTMFGVEENTT